MRAAAFIVAALIFWLSIFPVAMSALIPASWWLDVRNLTVHPAAEGDPVQVEVDLVVHRDAPDTLAVVTIRRDNGDVICRSRRQPSYETGDSYPVPMDLTYWLEIPPNPQCNLTPGIYQATKRWTVNLPMGIRVSTDVRSNFFEIFEPVAEGCLPSQVKVSARGLYHMPGDPWYDRTTTPIACFNTAEEAEAKGYTRAGDPVDVAPAE